MARKLPSLEAQKVALAEAKRRIKIAVEGDMTDISFADLNDLTEIPATITKIRKLFSLSIEDTAVSDLTVLADLEHLMSIDLDDTLVMDLSPLARINSLYTIFAANTLVDDLSSISSAPSLMTLQVSGTLISDISPLAQLPNLRNLSIARTKVTDITPIAAMKNLSSLDISGTGISDLGPLKDMQRLYKLDLSNTPVSNLAPISGLKGLFNPVGTSGLTLSGCTELPTEIQNLSSKRNPGRTLEIGKFLGAQEIGSEGDDDTIESSSLVQRPAPYSFAWTNDVIEALPHHQAPFSDTLAVDIQQIVKEKIQSALESLTGNQIDHRLEAALQSALQEVSRTPSEIRDGILLMRLRTVQAVSTAYFSGDAEYEEGVRAAVMDAALSLEDLLAVYPGARTIDANRQALNFQAEGGRLEEYLLQSKEIIQIAENSEIVDDSAITALKEGTVEIDLLTDIILTTSNDVTRANALEKRASLASLQLLGVRNFVVTPLRRFVDELGPVAGESWKQAKLAIPLGVADGTRAVVSGSIKAGAAALATMLAGPIAGIAMLAASFVPLAKAAAKIAETASEDDGQVEQEKPIN